MSKSKIDGDVLVNRLSVGLANHKKLLASWTGLQTEAEPKNATPHEEQEEDDFKDEAFGYEQIGVGGIIPKDAQNGGFTRRGLTSDDKLLQQLLGKKAAKAHMAARQAPKDNSSTQKPQVPRDAKPEESEDEEEGRAATFKSKRRKTANGPQSGNTDVSENRSEDHPKPSEAENGTESEVTESVVKKTTIEDEDSNAQGVSPKPDRKPKSSSFLDEILAERSKKRKRKKAKNNKET